MQQVLRGWVGDLSCLVSPESREYDWNKLKLLNPFSQTEAASDNLI